LAAAAADTALLLLPLPPALAVGCEKPEAAPAAEAGRVPFADERPLLPPDWLPPAAAAPASCLAAALAAF
jgi:hypothetical protein